jgi:hypothetical protein
LSFGVKHFYDAGGDAGYYAVVGKSAPNYSSGAYYALPAQHGARLYACAIADKAVRSDNSFFYQKILLEDMHAYFCIVVVNISDEYISRNSSVCAYGQRFLSACKVKILPDGNVVVYYNSSLPVRFHAQPGKNANAVANANPSASVNEQRLPNVRQQAYMLHSKPVKHCPYKPK